MKYVDVLDVLSTAGQEPSLRVGRGVHDVVVTRPQLPELAAEHGLSWLRRGGVLGGWQGSLLLVSADCAPRLRLPDHPSAVLAVADPRRAMFWLLREGFSSSPAEIRIHPTARVHPSAVLGEPGGGYVAVDGGLELFPHHGDVVVGPYAEVGPCATVQRGAIGDTVIGYGAKLGPGVNVGHGANVGAHCLIASRATLGGSVLVGDRATIWQAASIRNGVSIGAGAVIGQGAVVLRDVPACETWAGNPARRLRDEAI